MNCNFFTYIKHLGFLKNSCKCVLQIELKFGIWKWWFFGRGESWSAWRKTPQSKGENQQQSQPKYTVYVCCHVGRGPVLSPWCTTLAPCKGWNNERHSGATTSNSTELRREVKKKVEIKLFLLGKKCFLFLSIMRCQQE